MSAPENNVRPAEAVGEKPTDGVPTRPAPVRGVLVIAAVLVVIAGLLIYGNLTMKVANPGPFGPQAFPWIVAVICLVAAALIVVEQVRHPRTIADGFNPDPFSGVGVVHDPFDESVAPQLKAEAAEDAPPEGVNWVKLGSALASMIVFTLVLEPVGWLISATLLFAAMSLSLGGKKVVPSLVIGAFIGGIIATTLVVFFAPSMASLAEQFGPAEYFALALFAFVAISTVVADSVVRGLAALSIGLALAMVGIDQSTGTARFTFGIPALFDGISVVVITVALLAIGEVLHVASKVGRPDDKTLIRTEGRPWLSKAEFRAALPAWLRGTAFGVPFGIIPAGGAEVPTFLAYGTERKLDARRKIPMFGKGSIQGVAGPEAAGNATAGSAMGALLALGLPTSATAALLLVAFRQYGMQPGPLLFERSADIVWALLA
ncbi:MAG TPA: tripartite tricarboxylate transporter permease, partial [Arachnia sp.]|nr:tripartite tricarboxylate transporter permease [Arachnia sp.]